VSDHTADQPTPADSATPKMALVNAIWRAFPSVSLGAVTEAADAIIADIAAAGYQIAEAGAVTISVDLARRVQWAMRLTTEDYRDVIAEGLWADAAGRYHPEGFHARPDWIQGNYYRRADAALAALAAALEPAE